jgi:hypothetical protein
MFSEYLRSTKAVRKYYRYLNDYVDLQQSQSHLGTSKSADSRRQEMGPHAPEPRNEARSSVPVELG